jgi:hypothetical protein
MRLQGVWLERRQGRRSWSTTIEAGGGPSQLPTLTDRGLSNPARRDAPPRPRPRRRRRRDRPLRARSSGSRSGSPRDRSASSMGVDLTPPGCGRLSRIERFQTWRPQLVTQVYSGRANGAGAALGCGDAAVVAKASPWDERLCDDSRSDRTSRNRRCRPACPQCLEPACDRGKILCDQPAQHNAFGDRRAHRSPSVRSSRAGSSLNAARASGSVA